MSYADAVTLDTSPLSPGVYLAKTGMVIKGNVRDPVDGTALYLDWWQSRELAGDNLPRGKHTETHASWYSLSKATRCNHVSFLLGTLYTVLPDITMEGNWGTSLHTISHNCT